MNLLVIVRVFIIALNVRFISANSSIVSQQPLNEYNKKNEDAFKSLDFFVPWKNFKFLSKFNSSSLSSECRAGVSQFLQGLERSEMWAVKMFDATAKVPSGILSGNVNQYGDYDECLSVKQSQYCLAEIDLELFWKKNPSSFEKLTHSHFVFRGKFEDPQHRLPNFSVARWGICMPSKCTSNDLQLFLQEVLKVDVLVKPSMCKKAEILISTLTFGDYFARSLFILLLLAIIISSITVQYQTSFLIDSESKWSRLMAAFSVQNSWQEFNDIKKSRDQLGAIHGIRFFNALALLMSHKTVATFYNPYINRTGMVESLGRGWSVIGRTAIIYTDSFMMISGFLNAYFLMSDLKVGKSPQYKNKIITRIFRVSPNIVTVILFCTYVLPNLGSGPLWPVVVEEHAKLCKNYMWRNFLYIHNYFGFENMCLTHTHQVGIDMQLFLVTPFFVYLLWNYRKIGLWIISCTILGSTALRILVTYQHNLSHVVHFGITLKRMFATANLSYILPTHRATIYFAGVLLAYHLHCKKCADLRTATKALCWLMAFGAAFLVAFGPFHMSKIGYVYDNFDAIIFGSLSPIIWASFLGWLIYASYHNIAGFFGDFLSWKGFSLFTKISYSVYLTQFPIFFYNVGVTRHIDEYTPFILLQLSEIVMIILVSLLLTLFVEIPFQQVKWILYDNRRPKVIQLKKYKSTEQRNFYLRKTKQA